MSPTRETTNPIKSKFKNWFSDSLSLISPNQPRPAFPGEVENETAGYGTISLSSSGKLLDQAGLSTPCLEAWDEIRHQTHLEREILEYADGIIILIPSVKEIRIIYLSQQLLGGLMLNSENAALLQAQFAESELQLLKQLLCGKTLKQAAIDSNVSYETKRTQFKSLAARTGLRTQSEVIRVGMLSILKQISEHSENNSSLQSPKEVRTRDYLKLYYPDTFRYHEITLPEGQVIRIAETGPLNGEPVIWLHSQTLPRPAQFEDDWPARSDIRLIIPLRPGFLEQDSDRYGFEKHRHIVQATADIENTIRLLAGGKAKIIANSTGVPYALELAKRNPELVKSLVFCAAAYIGQHKSAPIRQLVSGVKNLVSSSELLTTRMFDNYLARMSTQAGARQVLETSYKNSPADLKIFREVTGDAINHSWFYESYRLSRHSVVMDVIMAGLDIWTDLDQVKSPKLFVHGKTDPINGIEDARKIASKMPQSRFIEMKGYGQSLFLEHMEYLTSLE